MFLTSRLRLIPDVAIVGEADNGAEAIKLVERDRPDVSLLDVQMPEVDGLSVVRLLRRRYLPLVVFVTAYDEYAVKAFEMNAVDYLTKPVAETRLRDALAAPASGSSVRTSGIRGRGRPRGRRPYHRVRPSRGSIGFRSGGSTTSCWCRCRSLRPWSPRANCCTSRRRVRGSTRSITA